MYLLLKAWISANILVIERQRGVSEPSFASFRLDVLMPDGKLMCLQMYVLLRVPCVPLFVSMIPFAALSTDILQALISNNALPVSRCHEVFLNGHTDALCPPHSAELQ